MLLCSSSLLLSITAVVSSISLEAQLAELFATEAKCKSLEVSGNDLGALQSLSMADIGLPIISAPTNADNAHLQRRFCHVGLAKSEPGLTAIEIEELNNGSVFSMMLVAGVSHREIDVTGATRQLIFMERAKKGRQETSHLHVFCPRLNRDGVWHLNKGLWNHGTGRLFAEDSLANFCPLALYGAPINVSWAISQGKIQWQHVKLKR